jgi:hypothetical protein
VILNHAQLVVRDVAASRAFSASGSGSRTPSTRSRASSSCATRPAACSRCAGTSAEVTGDAFHIGFQVATLDEVLAFGERARAAGLEEVAFDRAGGFGFARVRDPDGHAVEVYAAGP